MMYFYWKTKGIRPSVFWNMSEGEKIVLRAFYEYEMTKDDKKGLSCPFLSQGGEKINGKKS